MGIEYGNGFRGVQPTARDNAFIASLEFSHFGFSIGVFEKLDFGGDSSQTEVFASYSYPVGIAELSIGVDGFLNSDTGHRDSSEIFFEVRTEPLWRDLNFNIGQFFEVTHGFHSYTELKISRIFDPISKRLAIEPYALVSFGDFHTDDFVFNHSQVGFDSVVLLNEGAFLTPYAAIVLPLDGVSDFTGSSDLEPLVGVNFTYYF